MNDVATATADKVLFRKEGGVGYVTFNNPERHNAMSRDMWAKTGQILDDFRADANVRVVVLTGAGGKSFVSGADISEFEKQRANPEQVAQYNATSDKAFTGLYEFPKPTIAMIRGYCIGGGLGLALCCDMRIVTDTSKFGIPAAKLGLGYGYVGVKRLVDLVGPSYAKEIFFTARQFDAAEAYAMGLVNRVVPSADLETFVANYAATISANAPMTIHAVKVTIGEAVKEDNKRNIALSDALVKECFESNDYVEGRKAFMEKRKPVFNGN